MKGSLSKGVHLGNMEFIIQKEKIIVILIQDIMDPVYVPRLYGLGMREGQGMQGRGKVPQNSVLPRLDLLVIPPGQYLTVSRQTIDGSLIAQKHSLCLAHPPALGKQTTVIYCSHIQE